MLSVNDRSQPSIPSNSDDTVVAVSSPPGRSLRGMVRLSGPDVMSVIGQLLEPPRSDLHGLAAWPSPRHLMPCRLRLTADSTDADTICEPSALPALVTMFMAPNSYTGQDMAEIQVPGNPAVLDRLIHRVLDLGARPAEAGEFTFRAFLSGKLDLTEAEGVAATIAAVSDTQLKAASFLRNGQLGQWASDLADDVAHRLALVEAGIDFVDQDDVVPITPAQLQSELRNIIDRLDDLISHSRAWRSIESLPRVVLVGPPNSGKSTLFNTLLGQRRAVISPFAHTTRDVLTEPLTIEDAVGTRFEIMLVDIAGLDNPLEALDRQAQIAAREAIEQAELILWTSDGGRDVQNLPWDIPSIRVQTKADLCSLQKSHDDTQDGSKPFDLAVSSRTGNGVHALKLLIAQRLHDDRTSLSGQTLFLQPRHDEALRHTRRHLLKAQQILMSQKDNRSLKQAELIAAAMRQSLDDLALLVGKMTPDDVLGRVFATFCIGK